MAPPTRQISQEEWDAHEEIIKHLYYVDKLPLRSKDEGKRTLMKVMANEHGFLASPAQYDTKFRQWGLAKNLAKHEWEKLMWQQEELQRQGREARIMISGSVVKEPSRKRARRWIEPEQHIGYTIPPERKAFVEFRNGTGSWSRYADNEFAAEFHEVTRTPTHQNIVAQGNEDAAVSASVQASFIQSSLEAGGQDDMASMELELQPAASPSFPDWFAEYAWTSPYNDHFQTRQHIIQNPALGYQDVNDTEIGGQLVLGSSSHIDFIDSMLNASPIYPASSLGSGYDVSLQQGDLEATEISAHENLSSSQELQIRPRGLAEALLQHAKHPLGDNVTQFQRTNLPDVEDVIDSLESLLPGEICLQSITPDSQIIERTPNLGPGLKALLYSLINGFAGLRNIPRSWILKVARADQQIRSCLFKLLNMGSYSMAKPLADNLFRAAVESCDPQAVAMIMSITRNNPEIAIDPNNIVCEFDGRDYTPIELAAKFRNIEIVQALLTAKADPNKTYSEDKANECGALELAIRKWGKLERVDSKLVKLLLDCGAEVRTSLVEVVVRWGYEDFELLQMLMRGIPDSQHFSVFNSGSILRDTIEYLENEAATGIVQRFFEACKSTNCGKCAPKHPKLLQDMLVKAAGRGNLDLVEFLTPQTEEKQLALAAAVRSGNSQLINFLLDKGATVDGPVVNLYAFKHKMLSSPTTPLAEAIRAQDHSRIQEFEQRGALTCIGQEDHFRAAVFAAAETGDVAYLKKVLELVPAYRGCHLSSALMIAIRNDHTEAALILLGAGADVNYRGASIVDFRPLHEALERQNKRVVDAILESDLDPTRANYLEFAALWGDREIIQDLILMGANLNTGEQIAPLVAAVANSDKPLVDHLLRLGASANLRGRSGSSPLEAAVKNGDHDMIEYLMSQGASVTDSKAFMYAAKHDRLAYNMFLSAFEKLSPMERKGFGGDLLIHFIAQGDLEAVDALIKAKMDINKVCWLPKKGIHSSPLGFAITHKKGTDHALVRKLLEAGGESDSIAAKPFMKPLDEPVTFLETPLLLAIQTRNEEMVKLLINAGALVHRPARRGVKRTPLQKACEINSSRIAKLLLLNGAVAKDAAAERGGHTALQLAAINGSIKIARMLLDNGADPHGAPSKVNGRTAFEGAAENGCVDMLRMLHDAALIAAFDQEELQSARQYAAGKGHRSCVDYIDSLLNV